MSYKDITPGDKLARAKAGRFIKSSKGTLGIEIAFEFEEPSTKTMETMNWQGWLSDAARDRTMETLVEVLGFSGSENINSEGVLIDPDAFNYRKDVKLVVEMETNPNDNKEYPRIKWVNNVGGSGYAGVGVDVIKNELAASGFKAAFLAARQKVGAPAQKEVKNFAPNAGNTVTGFNPNEEIPF